MPSSCPPDAPTLPASWIKLIGKRPVRPQIHCGYNFLIPPMTVAKLYRCRWQVELFFRWIKQHLRIKAFSHVADILNARGLHSGKGKSFDRIRVRRICRAYGLKSRYQRLREIGLLTREELAAKQGVDRMTISKWRQQGRIKAHLANDDPQYLYEDPRWDFAQVEKEKREEIHSTKPPLRLMFHPGQRRCSMKCMPTRAAFPSRRHRSECGQNLRVSRHSPGNGP